MEKILTLYRKLAILLYCLGEFFFNPLLAGQDIFVDYFTFQSSDVGKTHLELYFSLNNSKIQFIADGKEYTASVSSSLYIFNDLDQLVKKQSLDHELVCDSFNKTINSSITNYFKFKLDINPATYKAILVIEDKNKNSSVNHKMSLSIPDYWKDFALSSPQIFTSQEDYKIPNINHTVFHTMPQLKLYYESYNLEIDVYSQNLTVEYLLKNESGHVFQKQTQIVPVNQIKSGFKTTFSVEHLPGGNYSLQIIQKNNNNTASSNIPFTLIQSPTKIALRKYDRVLDELQYIANTKDLETLRKLDLNKRQEGIDSFWKRYDPTPLTKENELKNEYYTRIVQANKTFSLKQLSGFETDFGMILVLFGKPDKISGSAPTQVWHYNDLNLKFTFISIDERTAFNLVDRGQVFADYMPR
ncbi:MAG: GWxTD domain-containing protein [Calditrichaeota bacterium]|nr:MAG: hypothetical protein DWQ03_18775 [Calditrichota bacterium]MBL1205267.1 GWxTD domain-containing protein [Calditrichota bacterium]NOG45097.1 GWxTD domain-containing protein [Calditrichota bacterium]